MCLGIPGQVVDIHDAEKKLGIVDVGGVRRVTNLACVVDGRPPEACIGEWVLVHVGFAMSRIDPEEAKRTLELLSDMGDIQEELRQLKESEALKVRGEGAASSSTREGSSGETASG
ncbi:MAG: HypC/HybG/HupF family hydrogenase formation chaperone [Myxococcota bacterium]